MTAGEQGRCLGKRMDVIEERTEADGTNDDMVIALSSKVGRINADLSVGVDVTAAKPLRANQDVCSVGMKTIGAAFQMVVTLPARAAAFLWWTSLVRNLRK